MFVCGRGMVCADADASECKQMVMVVVVVVPKSCTGTCEAVVGRALVKLLLHGAVHLPDAGEGPQRRLSRRGQPHHEGPRRVEGKVRGHQDERVVDRDGLARVHGLPAHQPDPNGQLGTPSLAKRLLPHGE